MFNTVGSLTYLLTPWSRVLLEKLTGFAANQEIPRILWNPKVHYRTHKRLQYRYTDIPNISIARKMTYYTSLGRPYRRRRKSILFPCSEVVRDLFSIMFGHLDHACMHKLPMWILKVGLHLLQQRTSWEANLFLQLVKKFSIFYRAQSFITMFTKACHLSLSWVKLYLSTPCHPISLIVSIGTVL